MFFLRSAIVSLAIAFTVLPALPATATGQVVLFDEGHGQRFTTGKTGDLDLSGLAQRLTNAGLTIKTTSQPLLAEELSSVDALILSGPFMQYTESEIGAIVDFINNGGKLAVMLHIGPSLGGLLERLGVDFSNGAIREEEGVIGDNSLNFRATRLESHPITAGLYWISFYGAWAVVCTDADSSCTPVAITSPASWIDLDRDGKKSAPDAVQSFPVVVAGTKGAGRFIVFGDDAIFQNKFLDEGNAALADNLAGWLK